MWLGVLFLYQLQDSKVQRSAIHVFYNTRRSLKGLGVKRVEFNKILIYVFNDKNSGRTVQSSQSYHIHPRIIQRRKLHTEEGWGDPALISIQLLSPAP